MTVYATTEELKKRIGDGFTQIYRDETMAAEDLTAAQSEIDAALGVRYRVPVTDPAAAALLKDWTLTLVEERASSRSGGGYPEKVKVRVDAVRANLRLVIDGKMIVGSAPAAPASGIGAETVIVTDRPVFTRQTMKGF